MKFEIGDRVRHRVSGEDGIVIERDVANQRYTLSTGLGTAAYVPEVCLATARETAAAPAWRDIIDGTDNEPQDEAPPAPGGNTLQVDIDGKRMPLRVLKRQGPGLICAGGGEIHMVLEQHALDAEHFRQLYATAPTDQ